MASAVGCSTRETACMSRRMPRVRPSTALSPRCRRTRLLLPAWSVLTLRIWSPALGMLPMNRAFALWRHRIRLHIRRSSRPISPPATTACTNCSTPPIDATTTPLSTAPTADRALPSSARYLMTERPPLWIAFPCALSAPQSMETHLTGAFMRSPMPVLPAGHILPGARRQAAWSSRTQRRRRLSATRASLATLLSSAVSSCSRPAALLPSRAWADSTWLATPPTSKPWSSCVVASAAQQAACRYGARPSRC